TLLPGTSERPIIRRASRTGRAAMSMQPTGPSDSEAKWRASDHALRVKSFKMALAVFGGLLVLSVVLMTTLHVVYLPILTITAGARAGIIGWQTFGRGTRPATPPAQPGGWQQPAATSAPPPLPPLPPLPGQAPPPPPPPPPAQPPTQAPPDAAPW